MACAESTLEIRASPKDVLEFVMDLRRYREADKKVGPVLWLRRDGNRAEEWAAGRVAGLSTIPARITIELTPYSRLDVRSTLPGFNASFECDELPGGVTVVRHVECVAIPGPAGRLVGRWLQSSVDDELHRMKQLLEG